MDEQSKSRVFLLVEPTAHENVPKPKFHLPNVNKTATLKRDEDRLRAILFSFDQAILDAPNVLKDPAAFVRLAAAHGYPLRSAIQRERKYGNINENAMRMLAQQNCLGHRLIQLWKRLSPEIYSRVTKMNTYQPTSIEPFSPGAVRKMKNALLPLRDQMGFEIVRDLNLLDDPVAFLAMCQRIGYQGLAQHMIQQKPTT